MEEKTKKFPQRMENAPSFLDQTNPNPNPSLDDSLYLRDISNYLMSDEGMEENPIMDFPDKVSPYSTPSASEMNRVRVESIAMPEEQVELKFAFVTKSASEFIYDGYKWRKYGKKKIKSSPNPRNYFKCTSKGCRVKKRIERHGNDPRYIITTYQGVHNHETPTPTPLEVHDSIQFNNE